jgi:CheY-like chemotaxis protein
MARVLVVEDDPWSRRIVCELLEMRGHDVRAAEHLDDARTKLDDGIELVLLDIHVPGGGGEALLREIRHDPDPSRSALPVIALTASAMRGDRERFLRMGFTAYMSKPIDVASFGATIERFVGGRT